MHTPKYHYRPNRGHWQMLVTFSCLAAVALLVATIFEAVAAWW